MSRYADTRRDQQIADDYLAEHGACMRCRSMTQRSELAALGARCRQCYDAFCADANPSWLPNRPLRAEERARLIERAKGALRTMANTRRNRDGRQWARDLRAREDAGEQLTRVQREAWRSALRCEIDAAQAAGA